VSGIAGAWNLDGQPMAADVLAAMSGRLHHRGVDGERRRTSGSVGFAHQHLWVTPEEEGEAQPLVGPSGAMLVMDGRIDNRDELIAALRLERTVSDAACVLSAYEAWDDRFAERLNGDFAVAIFDPARCRLLVARDAIGVRPLYYFHNERLFAFASEIKALLAHPDIPTQPDDDGLADFMFIGARPLDRQDLTCFKNISALIPAHIGVITPTGTSVRRYWDFDFGRTIQFGSIEEYVDAFRERFAEAVRRRARSRRPVAVSVSGGLDSSSIFCQAEMLRRRGAIPAPAIKGFSHVSESSDTDESAFLLDIERQYGVEICRYPIEPLIGIVGGVDDQIRTIEAPFLDSMWGVSREVHMRAAASGARVFLTGHWGDQVLFSAAYLIDLFNQFSWPSILRHTREHARYFGGAETWVLRRRFLFDLARHHVPRALVPPLKWLRLRLMAEPEAKGWLSESFLSQARRLRYRPIRFPGVFHSAHARSLYLEARSKYHVQSMEWNNKVAALYGLDAAFPFLDRDLLVFLMAIPGEFYAWQGVPRALLREAMRGILPEPIRVRTWKTDFTGFVNQGVAQDLEVMLHALSAESTGVRLGYFDAARLVPEMTRLAAAVGTTACVESWALTDTFGLEMWLQVFSGDVPKLR
jgi:asparagine synthase (glutamine-hydrolysing)